MNLCYTIFININKLMCLHAELVVRYKNILQKIYDIIKYKKIIKFLECVSKNDIFVKRIIKSLQACNIPRHGIFSMQRKSFGN